LREKDKQSENEQDCEHVPARERARPVLNRNREYSAHGAVLQLGSVQLDRVKGRFALNDLDTRDEILGHFSVPRGRRRCDIFHR
jgi:hypothetical protein